jgi:hypothetical protein
LIGYDLCEYRGNSLTRGPNGTPAVSGLGWIAASIWESSSGSVRHTSFDVLGEYLEFGDLFEGQSPQRSCCEA